MSFPHPIPAASRALLSLLACALLLLGFSGCSAEARKARHLKRGDEFYASGQFDRAEIEYLNVIKIDQQSGTAMERLGTVYLEQGRYGRVYPYFKRAVELSPNDLAIRRKRLQLFLAVGSLREARDEALFVLEKAPADPDALLALAESSGTPDLLKSTLARFRSLPAEARAQPLVNVAEGIVVARGGDARQATELFEKAVAKDPKLAAGHSALAAAYAARNDLVRADAEYRAAAELSGPRSPRGIQWALFKVKTQDLDGARKILEAMIAKAPYYVPASLRLVDVAIAQNKLDEAQALLKKVLELDSTHPEALMTGTRLALQRGDNDRALQQVEALVRLYPQSLPAQLESARVYVARNDTANALTVLNQLVLNNPGYVEAAMMLSELNLQLKNTTAAINALKVLIERNPYLTDAQVMLAMAYRQQGDLTQALEVLKKIESLSPGKDQVTFLSGVTLRELNRPDEARATFERALSRNPRSTDVLEQLVELDFEAKKPEQGLARIKNALALRPDSAPLLRVAGRFYIINKNYSAAETVLKKAIEQDPDSTPAYMLLARSYIDAGDSTQAINSLRQVTEKNKKDTGAWFILSTLLAQQNNFKGAIEACEQFLANATPATPNYAYVLNNLAQLTWEQTGQLDKAFDYAKRAREASPHFAQIADTAGWLTYQKGDYLAALPLLKESAEGLPKSGEAQYHLGMTYYMLGQLPQARTTLNQALALDSTLKETADIRARLALLETSSSNVSESVRTAAEQRIAADPKDPVAWSRLATYFKEKGNLDKAIEHQEKALQLYPGNTAVLTTLASLYAQKGDFNRAMELAKAARKQSPDDLESLNLLGRLSLRSKDYATAYTMLQEVSQRTPDNPAVYGDLIKAAVGTGRLEEARSIAERARRTTSNADVETQAALISAGLAGAASAESKAIAQKVLAGNADDVGALYVKALGATAGTADPAALEKVVSIAPSFTPAKRDLAILLAADSANDRRTLELGEQARVSYSSDLQLAKALGTASYRLGEWRKAASFLQQASPNYSQDAALWFMLGISQGKLDQSKNSIDSLSKALELGLTGSQAEEARKIIQAAKRPEPTKAAK